jgi:hypothetical protein
MEQTRDLIQRVMGTPALLVLLRGGHLDDCDLYANRHLTRQRKHLVHRDPGSDRCIAQPSFANRFLHASGSQFSDVSQHRGESLFSLGYCDSLSRSDRADGMSGDPVKFGNVLNPRVRFRQ